MIYFNTNRIDTIKNIVRENGFFNFVYGLVRKEYYNILKKRFEFEQWHTTPYQLRPYAMTIVKTVNKMERCDTVVEIGCGIGDLIRNVNARNKYGIDVSNRVIDAARYLDRYSKIKTNYSIGDLCGGWIGLL